MNQLQIRIQPLRTRRARLLFFSCALFTSFLLSLSFAQSPQQADSEKAGGDTAAKKSRYKKKSSRTQAPDCKTAQGRAELLADEMIKRTDSTAASVRFVKAAAAMAPNPADLSQKANFDFLMNAVGLYKMKSSFKFDQKWIDAENEVFEKRMSQFSPGTPQWIKVYNSLTAGAAEQWLDAITMMNKTCELAGR
jgi:hypothetical protein